MSTGNMPQSPDQPTTMVGGPGSSADAVTTTEGGQVGQPTSLAADMARIIEEQAEVIAQKQYYHSQMMLGVSALGTDVVSARQSALAVAGALRETAVESSSTLVNLGDPQYAQVNDRTLPYRFNSQISGLLQGIMLDAIAQAYSQEPGKLAEARLVLGSLFGRANDAVMQLPKAPPRFQAPAMSPEPGGVALPEAKQPS